MEGIYRRFAHAYGHRINKQTRRRLKHGDADLKKYDTRSIIHQEMRYEGSSTQHRYSSFFFQ